MDMRLNRRKFLRLAASGALVAGTATHKGVLGLDGDSSSGKKRAFAHYMTGQGTRRRNQSEDEWQADIRDALTYGIDGWQFNFGRFKGPFARNIRNFMAALEGMGAEGEDFQFFPSFDCNRRRELDLAGVAEWFSEFYDHPNHFRLNGIPVLSVWQAANVGNDIFVNLKARMRGVGKPIAFMPWIATRGLERHMGALFEGWSSIDGFIPWVPGKRAEDANALNSRAASFCRTYGKTLMAGQGFGMLQINKAPRYVNKHAAESITEQMMPLIRGEFGECRLLSVGSWNDFGEDHHITPHPPWGPIHGIHPVWCHIGYAAVLKHYLDWWKSGSEPRIDRDQVAIFHMTQLAREGKPPFRYEEYHPDKAEDIVYVTAILRSPGTLTVTSGNLEPVSFEAPAGVSHWRTQAAPGEQRYSLARGQGVIFERTSARTIDSPPKGPWTWSLYSEVARS